MSGSLEAFPECVARIIAVIAVLLTTARLAHAQQVPSDCAIRAILKAWVDAGRAPGVVVGILQNGQSRYTAYGSAGPGRPPLDEHTIFEIGSLSKTFTSIRRLRRVAPAHIPQELQTSARTW